MSLLASAGIYLVLDVNSPLANHHLNRYEPWTTYNPLYLTHVFEVVEQFGAYNNTLGFFAGNEVVNDKMSAKNSPVYIKTVIKDIKQYILRNLYRPIPVGYSAADDLKYRVLLSSYLECVDTSEDDTVDFYGVNSYQWCGAQTFHTSGYDALVKDYSRYSRPVFFSEYVYDLLVDFTNDRYGCNEVTPRTFEEVQALHSDKMAKVFSGGLIYEFTEEPNKYGLVKVLPNGNIQLLSDFHNLRGQHHLVSSPSLRISTKQHTPPKCKKKYKNLATSQGMPESLARDLIADGVSIKKGKYVTLLEEDLTSTYKIYASDGDIYMEMPRVEVLNDISLDWNPSKSGKDYRNGTYKTSWLQYFSSHQMFIDLLTFSCQQSWRGYVSCSHRGSRLVCTLGDSFSRE